MKVGADDKKKLALAVGLTVVALVTVYVQFFAGDSATPVQGRRARGVPDTSVSPQVRAPRKAPSSVGSRSNRVTGRNFEPVWRRSHEDETFDPLEADPTLQTALLTAVRSVPFSGVSRNIFEFTTRKAVETGPSPGEVAKAAALQKRAEAAAVRPAAAAKPAAAAAVSTAPKVNWKYYGFASDPDNSRRRAFFLDGEDVLIGGEGDIFKKRYKVVRIGLTSAVIQDMQYEAEQTLQLEAPKG